MEQTYFISGANRGIGFSMVQQLAAKSGVKIIATARDPTSATALNELAKANLQVKVVQLDVSDEESIKKAAKMFYNILTRSMCLSQMQQLQNLLAIS